MSFFSCCITIESLVDGEPLHLVADPLAAPSSLSPSESDLFRTLSVIVDSFSYVGNEVSAVGESIAEISSGTVVDFDGDSS